MSHGSKKWITAYDGKIKRSNDRTKKDYYRGLREWDDWQYGRWNRFLGKSVFEKDDFCPQCKHVSKPIRAEEKQRSEYYAALKAEYETLYGDASRAWEKYHRDRRAFSYDRDHLGKIHIKGNYPILPKGEEPPQYHQWLWKHENTQVFTQYNARSYMCYKHERMYEVKNCDKYWRETYGRSHTEMRRAEYRYYRAEIKNLMQRAKYDEEFYDAIFDKKNGWLD